jgi:hypothetical protein
MSGEHYEQSRRGTLSRFISSSDKKSDKVDAVNENKTITIKSVSIDTNNIQKVSTSKVVDSVQLNNKINIKNKEFDENNYQRPLHWQPWQPEKYENDNSRRRVNDTLTSSDARVNIVMVLIFSLSMIATMLLANILSQF